MAKQLLNRPEEGQQRSSVGVGGPGPTQPIRGALNPRPMRVPPARCARCTWFTRARAFGPRGALLVRTRPQRGGGGGLYGPQNCRTEQGALSAPEAPEILF